MNSQDNDGRVLLTLYVIFGNNDQTEGRGGEVPRERWSSLEAASARILNGSAMKQWGVMGVQGITLKQLDYIERERGLVDIVTTPLWGHRKGWDGKWSDGWMDNREAPTHDPEYAEWVRLCEKFGVPVDTGRK